MSAGMLFVLWKGFMGFVLPIAFGVWELHRLRQYRDEDAGGAGPMVEPEPIMPPPVAPRVTATRARAKVPELV